LVVGSWPTKLISQRQQRQLRSVGSWPAAFDSGKVAGRQPQRHFHWDNVHRTTFFSGRWEQDIFNNGPVQPAYNPYFSACLSSQNNIFISQKINETVF
jgi:hypothetical protein